MKVATYISTDSSYHNMIRKAIKMNKPELKEEFHFEIIRHPETNKYYIVFQNSQEPDFKF